MPEQVHERFAGNGQFLATNAWPRPLTVQFSNIPTRVLQYSSAVRHRAYFPMIATRYPGVGTALVDLHWFVNVAGGGNVVWNLAVAAIGIAGENVGAATFGSAVTSIAAAAALVNTSQITTVSMPFANLDGLQSGSQFVLRVERDGANAADTAVGIANLMGLTFRYSDTP